MGFTKNGKSQSLGVVEPPKPDDKQSDKDSKSKADSKQPSK